MPFTQAVHGVLALPSLSTRPAVQLTHCSVRSAEYVPVLQFTQDVLALKGLLDASVSALPFGQAAHLDDPVAANVPGAHAAHVTEPGLSVTRPAAHREQPKTSYDRIIRLPESATWVCKPSALISACTKMCLR